MKNFIILLCFTGVSLSSLSQNITQVEYFIDTDLGYGKNMLVNVPPSGDGAFPFTVDFSSVLPGYHKLYIRTKDSDGKWSLTARKNVEVFTSESKTTIISGEYFIDTDPGFGSGTPITVSAPDSMILQNFTVIASGLPVGYHKLYGRFLDNQGKWGFTFRRNIEVYASDINLVSKAEYFFTSDEGFGNCASVTFNSPAADGSFSFNIPLSQVPAGADTLFIRVQDMDESKWSITQWKNIAVALPLTLINFTVTSQNNLAQLNWQTTNEVNTAYFNVQRSTDGRSFTTVGKVKAMPATSSQNNYTYPDDIRTLQAGKVYYRLQMTDKDEKFTYSGIRYVTISGDGRGVTMYPNPANNYFVIGNYNNIDVSNAVIVVKDLAGRMLVRQKFNHASEQKINITALSKGIYMVSVVTPNQVQTQKLIVE